MKTNLFWRANPAAAPNAALALAVGHASNPL